MFWPSREESKRIRQIVHVLFEYHLGFIAAKLSLNKVLPLEKKLMTERFKPRDVDPVVVRHVLEQLGGSFIKLGQLLSLRPDLIPAEYCEELSKLQDSVPPFPGKVAKEIVQKELGRSIKRLFKRFDEKPIASASIGQVHTAELKDGTKVAVKVQRPGMEEMFETDIKLLKRLAAVWKKKHPSSLFDPTDIVAEFERYTRNELDYLVEARHIERFYENFKESKTVIIPQVFDDYCTARVLTMEEITGKRLSSVRKLTPAQKKRIVNTVLESEWAQIFKYGYFHGDPHPGNFLLKKNGKVALLDFGIVGVLDDRMRGDVTDLFVSLVHADTEGVVDAAVNLGVADGDVDRQRLERDLKDELGSFYGRRLEKIQLSKVLNNIMAIFRKNRLRVSSDFVLLAKAAVTIEGFAAEYNPRLNFVEHAKPFVNRMMLEKYSPKRMQAEFRKKASDVVSFAESLPRRATKLVMEMDAAHKDLIRINTSVSTLASEIDKSSNRLTLGFLAGTLFIASSFMLPYDKTRILGLPAMSFMGYAVALLILLVIFISMMRERKL